MEYILHLIFTNILWYTKGTEQCVHLHAQPEQSWAHCDQLHEHHNAHWREHCVVLSTLRTVFRCIAHMCSYVICGSSLVCVSSFPSMVIGMRTCSWVFSSPRLSTSSSSLSSTSSWILPWCLTRIPWKIPCATPASGAWLAWTMSHPTQCENACTEHELVDLTFCGQSVNKLARSVTKWTPSMWQTIRTVNFLHSQWSPPILSCEQCGSTLSIGVISRFRFCRRSWWFRIIIRRVFCIFRSRTFVPISWMCKRQMSVSHSSTESETISLDAGLRIDALDLVIEVLGIARVIPKQSPSEHTRNRCSTPKHTPDYTRVGSECGSIERRSSSFERTSLWENQSCTFSNTTKLW